jgi:hypothetical protein
MNDNLQFIFADKLIFDDFWEIVFEIDKTPKMGADRIGAKHDRLLLFGGGYVTPRFGKFLNRQYFLNFCGIRKGVVSFTPGNLTGNFPTLSCNTTNGIGMCPIPFK